MKKENEQLKERNRVIEEENQTSKKHFTDELTVLQN